MEGDTTVSPWLCGPRGHGLGTSRHRLSESVASLDDKFTHRLTEIPDLPLPSYTSTLPAVWCGTLMWEEHVLWVGGAYQEFCCRFSLSIKGSCDKERLRITSVRANVLYLVEYKSGLQKVLVSAHQDLFGSSP